MTKKNWRLLGDEPMTSLTMAVGGNHAAKSTDQLF